MGNSIKYISLFSGIGGFEVAINKHTKKNECIFYSEIKPSAIEIYESHFPSHLNIGDISKIDEKKVLGLVKQAGGCDLLVGGFPCTNLSSAANINGDNTGLEGPKSGLFWKMIRLIKIVKPKYIIIENNNSMTNENKEKITTELQKLFNEKIYMTMLNGADFGVQTRRRLYWTNFIIDKPINCSQNWEDVLDKKIDKKLILSKKAVEGINKPRRTKKTDGENIKIVPYNNGWKLQKRKSKEISRWQLSFHSDNMTTKLYSYPVGKTRTILASGALSRYFIDRRGKNTEFIVRRFSIVEIEKLFNFPFGWTSVLNSDRKKVDVLGNSVVVNVIYYILEHLPT